MVEMSFVRLDWNKQIALCEIPVSSHRSLLKLQQATREEILPDQTIRIMRSFPPTVGEARAVEKKCDRLNAYWECMSDESGIG